MTFQIVVGLPVYNEASALPSLLERLSDLRKKTGCRLRIIVINDGSTDETEIILQKYCGMYAFVTSLTHQRNRGLGAAINTLFQYAAKNCTANDVLITLDADNTHNPNIIPNLVDKLKKERLDVVIASRFMQGGKQLGVSVCRKIYSKGAKYFFKKFFPILNVNDYSSGYRCYHIGYLQKAMAAYDGRLITTDGFECMAEILAKFSVLGVQAGEVPLVLEYHFKKSKSKMNVAKTIYGYFTLLKKVRQTK